MGISMTADRWVAPGGISCREFVEVVTNYLEGVLHGEVRVRFEAHLAGCEGCAAYLEQMRRTLLLTGALGTESLPVEGRDRLLDAFRGWRDADRTDARGTVET
jgi:anti-sigma factor RsiW